MSVLLSGAFLDALVERVILNLWLPVSCSAECMELQIRGQSVIVPLYHVRMLSNNNKDHLTFSFQLSSSHRSNPVHSAPFLARRSWLGRVRRIPYTSISFLTRSC